MNKRRVIKISAKDESRVAVRAQINRWNTVSHSWCVKTTYSISKKKKKIRYTNREVKKYCQVQSSTTIDSVRYTCIPSTIDPQCGGKSPLNEFNGYCQTDKSEFSAFIIIRIEQQLKLLPVGQKNVWRVRTYKYIITFKPFTGIPISIYI